LSKLFQCSLDPVIRLHRLLEQRQEAVLQIAQSKLNDCRRKVDSCSQVVRELSEIAVSADQATPGIELQLREMRRRAVLMVMSMLRAEVDVAGNDVRAQTELLSRTRQEREKVETIRDSMKELWTLRRARQEQRWMDEMFLLRRRR
jgi:flagellar export protein FliJ